MIFFAKNLKHLRSVRGLKQSDMLDLAGFKQSTWNGYERGASTPNIDDLIRISDFFGIGESDLLHADLSVRASSEQVAVSAGSRAGEPGRVAAGMVEESGEQYGQVCNRCAYLTESLRQKQETIDALNGQVAVLQQAVDAFKLLLKL